MAQIGSVSLRVSMATSRYSNDELEASDFFRLLKISWGRVIFYVRMLHLYMIQRQFSRWLSNQFKVRFDCSALQKKTTTTIFPILIGVDIQTLCCPLIVLTSGQNLTSRPFDLVWTISKLIGLFNVRYQLLEIFRLSGKKIGFKPKTSQYSSCRFLMVLCTEKGWAASWQSQQNVCAPNEDSDQPGRPPSPIWVFSGRLCHFVGFVMRRLRVSMPSLVFCPLFLGMMLDSV